MLKNSKIYYIIFIYRFLIYFKEKLFKNKKNLFKHYIKKNFN